MFNTDTDLHETEDDAPVCDAPMGHIYTPNSTTADVEIVAGTANESGTNVVNDDGEKVATRMECDLCGLAKRVEDGDLDGFGGKYAYPTYEDGTSE